MTGELVRAIRPGEFDYELTIVCDHTGMSKHRAPIDAPPRTVAVLLHRPHVDRFVGRIDWLEAVLPDDPDYRPAGQHFFDIERRTGRRPMGMGDGTRWRFWCKDCDVTILKHHSAIVPRLDQLRQAGWRGPVTVAALTATRRATDAGSSTG